jgi:general secretion pathway protein G
MAVTTVTGKRQRRMGGFTLVELMVVLAILLTIISIAIPMYHTALTRSKEAVLSSNLSTMRHLIDQYTYDKETPPQSLEDLVSDGYIRSIPFDPITGEKDTWEEISDTGPTGESGLFDVRSGSDKEGLNGTPYKDW